MVVVRVDLALVVECGRSAQIRTDDVMMMWRSNFEVMSKRVGHGMFGPTQEDYKVDGLY